MRFRPRSAAAQEHFSYLCRMLGQPTPAWAVWAAYGWPEDPAATDDETILGRQLALNVERAG